MSQVARKSAFALTIVGALALAGCAGTAEGPADAGDEPQQGGTVHMLQNTDFSYLDPARGWDGGVNAFYRLMYRGLTMQAAGDAEDPNAIVPDMATSLGEESEDGLTWTYTLKEDLAFDNGDPITSAEVKFGISRAWDPQIGIGSPYLKNVIDAPDDYEGPYVSGDLPRSTAPSPEPTPSRRSRTRCEAARTSRPTRRGSSGGSRPASSCSCRPSRRTTPA